MSLALAPHSLDRFAEVGDLAMAARKLIGRGVIPLAIVLAVVTGTLWFSNHPGTFCFALIAAGTLLVLLTWQHHGVGLPIVPLLAVQNLVAYSLPIVVNNESVMGYPPRYLTAAGFEVLVFSAAMAGAWRFGLQVFTRASPLCYALQGFEDENLGKLSRLGLGLSAGATVFVLLQSLGLLDFLFQFLPTGTSSIINVIIAATSTCGFFLSAMMVSKGTLARTPQLVFWMMFALNCYLSASSFLLSSTTMTIFSVLIGLFWGSGRVPWKYLLVVVSLLTYFNAGKTEMRERYWRHGDYDIIPQMSFTDMPAIYQEWTLASYEALTGAEDLRQRASDSAITAAGPQLKSGQSLFDRVNNLQNILFVIAAIDGEHHEPLGGATYSLIPPLLIPRILWPDKPRSHEGQVLLNVHFGRQDLNATFQTYVAWGLQAEAYGNYGPIAGNLGLGVVVGLLLAWAERFLSRKLVLSMEGFLGFTLFLGIANSFEMVASVLVTSVFQSFFPVVLASRPFVEQVVPVRPEPDA